MKASSIGVAALITLSLAGAYASFELLAKHYDPTVGGGVFALGCKVTGGEDSCGKVLASCWSYIPSRCSDQTAAAPEAPATAPAAATQPQTQPAPPPPRPPSPRYGWLTLFWRQGLPAALVGLMYFSVLAIWFIGVGRPNPAARAWHWLPIVLCSLGLLGSLYFLWVMFFKLEDKCFWCIFCHACNVIILPLTLLLMPKRRAPAPTVTVSEPGDPAVQTVGSVAAYPLLRHALVTVLAMVAVGFAELVSHANINARRQVTRMNMDIAELVKIKDDYLADGKAQLKKYYDNPVQQIELRPNEHLRSGTRQSMMLVIFADFACSHCREAGRFIDDKVQPLFQANKMAIVFKHYPLQKACNPALEKPGHNNACSGSWAVEAAYLQGGNEAFWRAHDKLFAEQAALLRGAIDWRKFAEELKLNPDDFIRDMNGETVRTRVSEDIALGQSLGMKEATPRVYVGGREVPGLSVWSIAFWRELAGAYQGELLKQSQKPGSAAGH